jgi:hypothetical protein
MLLQIISLVFAFSIRKVKIKGLNDAKYIAVGVYITSIVTAIIIVISYTLTMHLNSFAGVFCMGFFIGTTAILGLVILPPVRAAYVVGVTGILSLVIFASGKGRLCWGILGLVLLPPVRVGYVEGVIGTLGLVRLPPVRAGYVKGGGGGGVTAILGLVLLAGFIATSKETLRYLVWPYSSALAALRILQLRPSDVVDSLVSVLIAVMNRMHMKLFYGNFYGIVMQPRARSEGREDIYSTRE